MKKLIALCAPVLLATSVFAMPVSAVESNPLENTMDVSFSSGSPYQQCFIEGNIGCKEDR